MAAYLPAGGHLTGRTKRTPARLTMLMLAASLLASCTGVEIEDHALRFNRATGSLGNRVMLLNAVRAAKGYPMQFSTLSGYTGKGRFDGETSLDLPFLLNAFGSPSPERILGRATSGLSFNTGVNNLQLTDLNTAETQREFRRLVGVNEFAYYRSQGWPSALVNTILIEELQLEPELVRKLDTASTRACEVARQFAEYSSDAGRRRACEWLDRTRAECADYIFPVGKRVQRRASRDGFPVVVYENDPHKHRCHFKAFQWFFTAVRVLDGASLDVEAADTEIDSNECETTWPTRKKKAEGGKDDDNEISKSVRDGKVSVDIGVNLKIGGKDKDDRDDGAKSGRPFALNIPKGLRPKLIPGGRAKKGRTPIGDFGREYSALADLRKEYMCLRKAGRRPINIGWRSPERMVRYLGDVLAAQAFEGKGQVRLLNGEGKLVDMLRVERGRTGSGSAAVSVEGPEGEHFHIPRPEYGANASHLSLQTLALVMEAFNQAVSGKELPRPPTLLLSGGGG